MSYFHDLRKTIFCTITLLLCSFLYGYAAHAAPDSRQLAALSQLPSAEALEALSRTSDMTGRQPKERAVIPANTPTRPFRVSQDGRQDFRQDGRQDFRQEYQQDFRQDQVGGERFAYNSLNKSKSAPLPYFGYSLFATTTDSSVAVNDIPVSDSYVVGPGDEVNLQLFGKLNKEYSLVVSRDGRVSVPELGHFAVSGYRFSQLEKELSAKINARVSGVTPVISLGRLKTIQVFVMGEAYQPGAYNLHGLATVTQAILAAGGVTEIGSLRNIQVKHDGKLKADLDLYDLLIYGNNHSDVRLQSGDTVFIAPKGAELTVAGEVLRPAIYEIKGETTLQQAIAMAGGTKAQAYLQTLSVQRITTGGRVNQTLDLTTPEGKKFHLQAGDSVKVMANTETESSGVQLVGELVRPGNYRYQKGMHVADVIRSLEQDLLPNTDLTYGLVVSYASKQGLKQESIERVRQFNLERAILDPQSQDNLALQQFDQVMVFAKEQPEERKPQDGTQKKQDIKQKRKRNQEASSTGISDTGEIELINDLEAPEAKNLRQTLLEPIIQQLHQQAQRLNPARIVEIAGGVRYPGTYPLTDDATLADLLVAGGSYLEGSSLEHAELSHYQDLADGSTILKREKINLAAGNGMIAQTRRLKAKDRLLVLQRQNWRDEAVVEIKGEVVFPGQYVVRKGDKLSSVLERAGGLTNYGYASGSVYTRLAVKEREQEQMQRLQHELETDVAIKSMQRQDGYKPESVEVQSRLLQNIFSVEPVGRLVIDLQRLQDGGNGINDIMVEDGDVLYVPGHTGTISIIGQVQGESTYLFDPKKSVDDYISLSGGPKAMADMDRVYVIRADGGFYQPKKSYWFSRNANRLREGDTIVVPINFDTTDKMAIWSTATQILYQTAVAWSAIRTTL